MDPRDSNFSTTPSQANIRETSKSRLENTYNVQNGFQLPSGINFWQPEVVEQENNGISDHLSQLNNIQKAQNSDFLHGNPIHNQQLAWTQGFPQPNYFQPTVSQVPPNHVPPKFPSIEARNSLCGSESNGNLRVHSHNNPDKNSDLQQKPIKLPSLSSMMFRKAPNPTAIEPSSREKSSNNSIPKNEMLTKSALPTLDRTPFTPVSRPTMTSFPLNCFQMNVPNFGFPQAAVEPMNKEDSPIDSTKNVDFFPKIPPLSNALQNNLEHIPVVSNSSKSEEIPPKQSVVPTSNEEIFKEHATLSGHKLSISAVKFASCGKLLASSSADRTVRIWEIETLKCVRILRGHTLGVNDLSWTSDCKFLVSASDDKTLKIFAFEGKCVRTLVGHTHYVFCCVYNPQGSMILSGSFDESLRLWNAVTGSCLRVMPAHTDPITSVDFNRDGSMFASSAYDGFVRIWEAANGRCFATMKTPDYAPVTYLKYSPNSKWLLTSSLDGVIRMWCTNRNTIVKEYVGHTNDKYCLAVDFAVSQKQHYVISGSEDGKIFIWDLQKKRIVQTIDGHKRPTLALGCNPKFSMFATGSIDSETDIKIWKQA